MISIISGKPCTGTCFAYSENFFAWEKPGIGRPFLFMCLQGLFYFSLVLVVEYGFLVRIWSWLWSRFVDYETAAARSQSGVNQDTSVRITRQSSVFGNVEDNDVAAERERITSTPLDQLHQTDSIIMKV